MVIHGKPVLSSSEIWVKSTCQLEADHLLRRKAKLISAEPKTSSNCGSPEIFNMIARNVGPLANWYIAAAGGTEAA